MARVGLANLPRGCAGAEHELAVRLRQLSCKTVL